MSSWYEDTELMHAFSQNWKNHKYIEKIGNRYFYTMNELRAYGQRAKRAARDTYSRTKRKVEDVTGVTAKRNAERYSAANKRAWERLGNQLNSRSEANSRYDNNRDRLNANNAEYDRIASKARAMVSGADKRMRDVRTSNDFRLANEAATLKDTSARKVEEARNATGKDAQYRYEKAVENNQHWTDRERDLRRRYEPTLNAAKTQKSRGQAMASENEAARRQNNQAIRDNEAVRNRYNDRSSDYEERAREDIKRTEKLAREYQAQYEQSIAGKIEKARSDTSKAISDLKKQASHTIESGKQKAQEIADAANEKISDLREKASDSFDAGMAWIDSIFKKKR